MLVIKWILKPKNNSSFIYLLKPKLMQVTNNEVNILDFFIKKKIRYKI